GCRSYRCSPGVQALSTLTCSVMKAPAGGTGRTRTAGRRPAVALMREHIAHSSPVRMSFLLAETTAFARLRLSLAREKVSPASGVFNSGTPQIREGDAPSQSRDAAVGRAGVVLVPDAMAGVRPTVLPATKRGLPEEHGP